LREGPSQTRKTSGLQAGTGPVPASGPRWFLLRFDEHEAETGSSHAFEVSVDGQDRHVVGERIRGDEKIEGLDPPPPPPGVPTAPPPPLPTGSRADRARDNRTGAEAHGCVPPWSGAHA